jgi:membrane protease YdiL (CAAX protease family)
VIRAWGIHKVAAFYGGAFVLALVVARVGGLPNLFSSHVLGPVDVALRLAGGLAGGALFSWGWDQVTRVSRRLREVERELAGMVGPVSVSEALLLAGLSGVGEEALFRGALQGVLGLPAASVLFALAHFPPRPVLWPWTVTAGVVGVALGLVTSWTGDILAAVAAHAGLNAVSLLRMSAAAPQDTEPPPAAP